MAILTPIQNSFNGGEFSPRMWGRTDLDKYRAAARLIQNFMIIPQGGLVRRSGTRYVADTALAGTRSRLEPFIFSDIQAYILEWSAFQLRIFVNEGLLQQQTLSNISPDTGIDTTTNEIIFTGHGYELDDGPLQISTTGILPAGTLAATDYFAKPAAPISFGFADVDDTADTITVIGHGLAPQMGPFQLNSTGVIPPGLLFKTDYYIGLNPDTNFFQLSLKPGGAPVNITGPGTKIHTLTPTEAYVRNKFRLAAGIGLPAIEFDGTRTPIGGAASGAGTGLHTLTPTTPTSIVLATPYSDADLAGMAFAQSADVLFIAHKNHRPRQLGRFSFQGFTLTEAEFEDGPYLDENADLTLTLKPAALSGNNVLLTASRALFFGSDVGRFVRILDSNEVPDPDDTPAWGYAKIISINPNTFQDADVVKESITLVDTGLDQVTALSHMMNTGDTVSVKEFGGTLPAGLLEETTYFVRAVTVDFLAFYDTRERAYADTSRVGLGAGFLAGVRVTSSVFNSTDHGYSGGEGPVQLTNDGGTLPTNLSEGIDYFIGFVDSDNITLSLSTGGDPVRIDDAESGGGTHNIQGDLAPAVTCQIDIKRDFQNTVFVTEWRLGAWSDAADIGYPRAVTFHEQRLWWAGSVLEPQKIWSSRTALFNHYAPTGTEGEDLSAAQDGSNINFTSAVYSTNAVTHEIGSKEVNVINWLAAERTLLVGTSSAAWSAGAAISAEAITPTNFGVSRAGAHGTAPIVPVIVDDRVLYISDTKQKAFSLGFSFDEDNYLADDTTLLAEHIGLGGFDEIAFAHEPNSTVWIVKGDGELAALALVRRQKIEGWARHKIGGSFVADFSTLAFSGQVGGQVDAVADTIDLSFLGGHGLETGDTVQFQIVSGPLPSPLLEGRNYFIRAIDTNVMAFFDSSADAVNDINRIDLINTPGLTGSFIGKATAAVVESVAVIPSPVGDASSVGRANRNHDQVWITVKRTVNGVTQRSVEFIEDVFESNDDLEDAFFVDGGSTYNATATNAPGPFNHLKGQSVDVLADGNQHLDLVVDATTGLITLPGEATAALVHAGYRMTSDFQSLRQPLAGEAGTAEANLGRIDHLALRLDLTLGGKLGPDKNSLLDFSRLLIPDDFIMDEVPPLFTGDKEIDFDGPWESYGEIYIRQDEPLPFSLIAIIARMQKSERGDRVA